MDSRASSNRDFFICMPWKIFGLAVLSPPLVGLAFSVIYSILYNFEASNSTHCRVWNFLPSISAATGTFEPQKSVWWWCIVAHTPARYFVCVCYMTFYNTISTIRWRQDNSIYIIACVILKMVEITALFLLTLVSSASNFGLHKSSFLTFIIASLLYMAGTILLQASLVKDTKSRMLRKSLGYKKIFFTANMLTIFTAGYTYWRHNTYCEPGVYSLFGLSEYLVVIFNIAFHATGILDFSSFQPLPQSQATEKVDHMLV